MNNLPERCLQDTMDTIEVFGWRQGDVGNEIVGFCLLGAVEYACRNGRYPATTTSDTMDMLRQLIRMVDPEHGRMTTVARWNDTVATQEKIDRLIELTRLRVGEKVADPAHEYHVE